MKTMPTFNVTLSNNHLLSAAIIFIFCFTTFHVKADEGKTHSKHAISESSMNSKPLKTQVLKKTDRNYVSFGAALNNFRSINLVLSEFTVNKKGVNTETVQDRKPSLVAQTYGVSFALGTYLTDHFKTEVRYHTGIIKDTLNGALDVNINYVFNWYMGLTQPITDYMSVYGLYGVSLYSADVTRREVSRIIGDVAQKKVPTTKILRPSETAMKKGLFGTRFGTTWMMGLDFKLNDKWYLELEYGQLINDTSTNIKVYQAGTHLRYEY